MPNTLVLSTGGPDMVERGQTIQLNLTCYSANALTTPTSYSLIYINPQGATTTVAKASITAASTGVLNYSMTAALSGLYRFTWTTTTPTGRASQFVQVVDNAGTN